MKPQNVALLALLRKRPHTGVTALEAFQEIGTFRLAARVSDLKAEGFDIWTDLVTTERGKRIAVYRLREKPVQLSLLDAHHLNALAKRRMLRDDVLYLNDPRNPDAWSADELVTIAAQSGIEVRRA